MRKLLCLFAAGLALLTSCKSDSIKEPEYRDIRDVRLIKAGILQSTAGVDLVYYNPNNFGVQLKDVHGDVYIDNAFLGRFELEESVHVGKKAEFIVPAVIKLDMIGAIKNQKDIWKKKEALVKVVGSARVKKTGMAMDIPINFEKMQNIERFRTLVTR